MREEFKWLVFASIAIGVVIVGLLILTFVPGLGWGWTRPSGYWMWSRTDFLNPWDFLANVTITLLLLAIPLSHIAWLVMAAIWLARSAGPPPAGGGRSIVPIARVKCNLAGRRVPIVAKNWREWAVRMGQKGSTPGVDLAPESR